MTFLQSTTVAESSATPDINVDGATSQKREEMSTFSQRIWNLSRLSFEGADRANFLYRHDLHRQFISGPGNLIVIFYNLLYFCKLLPNILLK